MTTEQRHYSTKQGTNGAPSAQQHLEPPAAGGKSKQRPITLRAMLAADCCAALPAHLTFFVHVLALHANNATGVGLTGQETLACYMKCSSRQIRNLFTELEALWASGVSPVGVTREKRFQTSDRYTLMVRDGAPLKLPPIRKSTSGVERKPTSGSTGNPLPPIRKSTSGPPPSEPEAEFLQTTEVALQSNPQRSAETNPANPAPGLDGPRGREASAEPDAAALAAAVLTAKVLLAAPNHTRYGRELDAQLRAAGYNRAEINTASGLLGQAYEENERIPGARRCSLKPDALPEFVRVALSANAT